MTRFINNLINRHILPDAGIKPRMQSRFDDAGHFPETFDSNPEESRYPDMQQEPDTTTNNKQPLNDPGFDIKEPGQADSLHKNIPFLSTNPSPAAPDTDNSKPVPEINRIPDGSLSPKNIPSSTRDKKITAQDSATKTTTRETQPLIVPEKAQEHKKQREKPGEDIIAPDTGIQYISPKKKEVDPVNKIEPTIKPGDKKGNLYFNDTPRPKTGSESGNRLTPTLPGKTISRIVNISIDRIEIRAQVPKTETKPVVKKEEKGILSLEQYLGQRKSQ